MNITRFVKKHSILITIITIIIGFIIINYHTKEMFQTNDKTTSDISSCPQNKCVGDKQWVNGSCYARCQPGTMILQSDPTKCVRDRTVINSC